MRIGVVMAGGLSSRMGRDKAALSWQGIDFLAHTKKRLLAAGCARVVISGNGYDIPDAMRGGGPLLALHSVLNFLAAERKGADIAQADQILIMPIDTPLLTVPLLQQLWLGDARPRFTATGTAKSGGHNAFEARYFSEHPLPVCLRNYAGLRANLSAAVAGGQRSMQGFLALLNAERIGLADDDAWQLLNTNHPQDYLQAQTLGREAGSKNNLGDGTNEAQR